MAAAVEVAAPRLPGTEGSEGTGFLLYYPSTPSLLFYQRRNLKRENGEGIQ
jgi:hypothetical protein